jgi:group I intron endonuclease
MKKKHYLVYKTTCLLNGKIYIGQHQTYDLNDGYIGSGTALKKDVDKFGIENFTTEILFDFETQKEMDNKERELVDEAFITRTDTYNMIPGGADGIMSITSDLRAKANKTRWNNLSEDGRRHYVVAANEATRNRIWTEESRKKISDTLKQVFKDHPEKNGMFGKHHTSKTKLKMRLSHIGERNSQFGKMWICNDLTHESKKILKTEPIPDEWRKGRFC